MNDIKAKDLRIGQDFGPSKISALHELCAQRPGPHVHVVTSGGARCFDFEQVVSRGAGA